MTTSNTPAVDADREAAVNLAHALNISCEDFTGGAADILVKAFTRKMKRNKYGR